jgi:hypothetical protein
MAYCVIHGLWLPTALMVIFAVAIAWVANKMRR